MMTREGRAVFDELRIRQGLDPRLPWGGRSPRSLTKAYARFSLRHEALPLDEVCEDSLMEKIAPEVPYGKE